MLKNTVQIHSIPAAITTMHRQKQIHGVAGASVKECTAGVCQLCQLNIRQLFNVLVLVVLDGRVLCLALCV